MPRLALARLHSRDPLDLANLADRQGAAERAALPGVGHGDLVAVVADAAVDQQVELLGHRAHDDEREHADGDAEDGEECACLSPQNVSY